MRGARVCVRAPPGPHSGCSVMASREPPRSRPPLATYSHAGAPSEGTDTATKGSGRWRMARAHAKAPTTDTLVTCNREAIKRQCNQGPSRGNQGLGCDSYG